MQLLSMKDAEWTRIALGGTDAFGIAFDTRISLCFGSPFHNGRLLAGSHHFCLIVRPGYNSSAGQDTTKACADFLTRAYYSLLDTDSMNDFTPMPVGNNVSGSRDHRYHGHGPEL